MMEAIILVCLGILMVELAAIGEYVSDVKQIMVQLFDVIEVYENESEVNSDD